ncbi:LysR family transcriptional regulator [Ottowia sp.]|uniref:LysR family transcriptional regulator n=1 Tax=Ottowia sp. TaxID=1898956 RepID=UPI00260B3C34|nr:LysR family transcriptional regulator [Ottowia sp.]
MAERADQFRIFIRVAELGSFVGAARALQLPPATVSAAIRRLEDELGAQLLHRTTRRVALTADGKNLLPLARRISTDIEQFYGLLDDHRKEASGVLTVDAPTRIARRMIAPALPGLLALHPELELRLRSNDRRINLVNEGVDCAIRVGHPGHDALVVKQLGELPLVNCASPAYLEKYGMPASPDDLVAHWAVGYMPVADMNEPAPWTYVSSQGVEEAAPVRFQVVVNDVESYLACCAVGMGLIQVPRFDVKEELVNGTLVEVLPEWPARPMPISAVYPHRAQGSRRVAAFLDWFDGLLRRSC